MYPDNYITRVYSHNQHLNEIEKKYSNFFIDDHIFNKNTNSNNIPNTQSLTTLLKNPILQTGITKNSSTDRFKRFDKHEPQFRNFDVLPYISSLSNNEQNLLPILPIRKNVKYSENGKLLEQKESPYADKKFKNQVQTRLSELKQKNLNVNLNNIHSNLILKREFQDFILTAKTIKINHHDNGLMKNLQNEQSKLDYFKKIATQSNLNNTVKFQQPFKFYIGEGNNGELVRKILNETRGYYWKETLQIKGVIHFKWQQNTKEFKYERLNSNSLYKQMVNHFEFHREISTKAGLFKNLRFYCEKNQIPLSEITPPTFFFDFEDENLQSNIQSFLNFYFRYMPLREIEPKKVFLNIGNLSQKFLSITPVKEDISPYIHQRMLNAFLNGTSYLWLFKPNGLNRGRGIKIFTRIDQLEDFLKEIINDLDDGTIKKAVDDEKDPKKIPNKITENNKKIDRLVKSYQRAKTSKSKMGSNPNKVFVVQKYIENPLLINQRKFDIRVWSLITHTLDFYFFSEGYIRTSSEKFDLNLKEKDNFFIHLTNNAVQKNNKNYGKFENGNQLSFEDLENLIKSEKNIDLNIRKKILPRIKELIKISLFSVRKKLNKEDRKFCFEIFGYDFIIDSNYDVWLIEVNTNPCIETSSPLLEMYIPRMLDDAFKLTIDKIFQPLNSVDDFKKHLNEDQKEKPDPIKVTYPMKGKDDEENLWEYQGNLKMGES